MKANNLSDHLSEFTEEEKLYKEYHWVKRDHEALRDFIAGIDKKLFKGLNFYIPELEGKIPMEYSSESWYWSEKAKDIYVHKHARYMPTKSFFHSFYEVHFIYNGHGTIELKSETIEMEEGDVCIISPGTHHIVHIFDDHSIDIVAKIRKSTFKRAFSTILAAHNSLSDFFNDTLYFGKYPDYALYKNCGDSGIKRLFTDLYVEHYNENRYFRYIMNHTMSTVFYRLLRNSEEDSSVPNADVQKRRRVESILDYIKENYADISLKKLSSEFHFAEQYMSKYIKEHAGMTYSDITRNIKLEKALELLDTTDMTIGNISSEVGYSSPENFMRQFKHKYGISPTSYRKRGAV